VGDCRARQALEGFLGDWLRVERDCLLDHVGCCPPARATTSGSFLHILLSQCELSMFACECYAVSLTRRNGVPDACRELGPHLRRPLVRRGASRQHDQHPVQRHLATWILRLRPACSGPMWAPAPPPCSAAATRTHASSSLRTRAVVGCSTQATMVPSALPRSSRPRSRGELYTSALPSRSAGPLGHRIAPRP